MTEELRLAGDSARLVRLTGEPWIGKTHLLRALSAAALRQGWTVAAGRSPRRGHSRPFDSLVDALDDLLATADEKLFAGLGSVRLRQLAEVFPALRDGRTDAGGCDTYAIFGALRTLLGQLAVDTGLLLVLDDAHRASVEVCDFAEYLLRHPPSAPVLTVLAHRTGPAARRLSGLGHPAPGLRNVQLTPLPDSLARALLPPDLDPLRVELIVRDAAGVPGLLRALADGGRGRPPHGPYSTLELTTGVPPLLATDPALDLHTLSPLGWRTVCAAAVVGDPFDPGRVAHVGRLPLADVLSGVDELHEEGIVRPDGDAGLFHFRHPVVRALVYHSAAAGRQHALRERAFDAAPEAELLERSVREALFVQPGRAVRAARRLTARPGAPRAAHLLLNKALVVHGHPAEAAFGYAELWARPHTAGPDPDEADAVVWRARALRLLGSYPAARTVLRTVDPARYGSAPHGTAQPALGELAALLLESGGPALGAALDAARRAVREAPTHDVLARGHALALLGAAYAADGSLGIAREVYRQAAEILHGPGDERLAPVVEALRWLGRCAADTGDAPRARGHLEHGLRIALRYGQGHMLGRLASALAGVCLDDGDPESAARHAEFATAEFKRTGASLLAVDAKELARHIDRLTEVKSRNDPRTLLSNREREVAALIGPGFTNQQIAATLNISVKTVETHMGRIFRKMGVSSRAQVAFLISVHLPFSFGANANGKPLSPDRPHSTRPVHGKAPLSGLVPESGAC